MSALLNSLKLPRQCLKTKSAACTSIRNHWNKDYKPASHPPKTEEERIAAAKKYGLLPSEYKTFPDDGTGYGDYPNIPAESGESRDPFYPWDNPELKRNFNEVLHVQADMIGEDRVDVNLRLRKSRTRQFTEFFGVMSILYAIYYWLEDKKMFLPLLPKQYPGEGKHYTFEPKS
ncbi:NADH dehydrogenase [ubiquinone] 1 beta subcomplex subunit 8, mitochondrial [Agrilus planipennis]|uniref:NADH dehydrogenase [ubiquinone] 1 beta subcomplex subunit 8, mitochondrial n=1 Tax=Agrilus planipennis TaxID=224129 RepID=A0A1W4WMQ4_AGRPL|nr:NADH dehydrogenase [ubiquinone] 1 beta subcomplex subunit 8, mitochondrial [Agrilus planipennis]